MIDPEELLQPIPGDRPCGPDLRDAIGQSPLDDAREARREEDPTTAVDGVGKEADWRNLLQISHAALRSDTKDLELACYLTEGLTRLEGFAGLRVGLAVVDGLVDRFWSSLHPGLDDGEILLGMRKGQLGRLANKTQLLAAVRDVTIAGGNDGGGLGIGDYEAARRLAQAARLEPQKHAEMVAAGTPTSEDWQRAFDATPPERHAEQRSDLEESLAIVERLAARCRELFEGEEGGGPGFGGLSELLEMAIDVLGSGSASDGGDNAESEDAEGASSPVVSQQAAGPIASRADAVHQLRLVASYLRQVEPHSPVSYLVDRAISWLSMPFEEVMSDLLKSDDVLDRIRETLGLQSGNSEEY